MSNLPFLKKKQHQSSGIVTEYTGPEKEPDQDYSEESLKLCAAALIHCINTGDTEGVARALKEAHDLCDSSPHAEGPHTNE